MTRARLTRADVEAAGQAISLTFPQMQAIIDVETSGGWFTDVRAAILDADGPGGVIDTPDGLLPKILFEAHHFSRLTKGVYNETHPDISSPSWDSSLYIGGQREYTRLAKAMSLDKEAALMSASWGLGQVMGFNFKLAGYNSVEEFVEAMKKGEPEQLAAMCVFIVKAGLNDEAMLISQNPEHCRPFARGYNGEGYERHGYHIKLATRCKFHGGVANPRATRVVIGFQQGQKGDEIRSLQDRLNRIIQPQITADGDYGPMTKAAIMWFQANAKLPVDGVAGESTLLALQNWKG